MFHFAARAHAHLLAYAGETLTSLAASLDGADPFGQVELVRGEERRSTPIVATSMGRGPRPAETDMFGAQIAPPRDRIYGARLTRLFREALQRSALYRAHGQHQL
jgi:hypothetical protein